MTSEYEKCFIIWEGVSRKMYCRSFFFSKIETLSHFDDKIFFILITNCIDSCRPNFCFTCSDHKKKQSNDMLKESMNFRQLSLFEVS